MCGIIGAQGGNEKEVRDALQGFAYRGPDAQGFFTDGTFSLGHARLSVIDPDPRSNQPFFDTDKRFGIIYNGEIYNYRELREELSRTHGVVFRTASDTEMLLEGYKVWGKEVLPRLRGMFAFAIYDRNAGRIFLARDHAGIKPLYYTIASGKFLFASELKGVVALMRTHQVPVEVDRAALDLYPTFGYVPSPMTLVLGVKKLERGSWLTFDLSSHSVEEGKWQPKTELPGSRNEFENLIRQSVLEHCVADVPVGAFFSGGVDSSLISALLHEAGMNLQTFSIRVMGRDEDEPYFRDIARHLGVKAQVAEFGTVEFDDLYHDIFSRMDDPIAGPSIFPTSFVSRVASKKVKVVLSGEGGDELFLGYPRLRAIADMRRRRSIPAFSTSAYLNAPSFVPKARIGRALTRLFNDPDTYYLLQTSPARDRSPARGWQAAREILAREEPLWFDRDLYLENMLLRKTDMATMYASIEGRVPLLGAQVWNAAPQFAKENLAHGGTKNILKDMLASYVPRELIDRPKSGFGIPIRRIFDESAFLRPDLDRALVSLKNAGLLEARATTDELTDRYALYGFGIVALYHALDNLKLL